MFYDLYEILNEYEQSRNNANIFLNSQAVRTYAGLICIMAVVSEMIIYIIFFHYLYKNDNSLNLTKLLERKVINARNRTNAITFFGHFCSFAIELTQIALYAAAQRRQEENIIN